MMIPVQLQLFKTPKRRTTYKRPILKLVHKAPEYEVDETTAAECYEGELLLLWAVLERAYQDACGNWYTCSSSGPELIEEAQDWMGLFKLHPEDVYVHEPWTFDWVCMHLDIKPSKVREIVETAVLREEKTRSIHLSIGLKELFLERAANSRRMYEEGSSTYSMDEELP